jgi:small subunit ribosomal protein S20
MANHVSAIKNVRITERRSLVNRMRKTRLRRQIRAMRRALANGEAQAAESLLAPTFSVVDRAAKWGIIKKNTAARYKSRLHNRLKALSTAA